jgi:outer membrane receptor protein involved in Fe transport
MFGFKHRNVARALVLSAPLSVCLSTFADQAAVPAPAGAASSVPPFAKTAIAIIAAPTGTQSVVIEAARQKLDASRNGLSPDTGSTIFKFGEADIAALPLGEATPLNQVVLQAPGVVQDSYGQLHVRGDHANVQYRIDGVVIPEAISGFGQSLETRFADSINVLTGALPAQYGYRTAAVVDIKTKQQAQGNSGSISYTGGTNSHHEESGEVAGAHGPISYYLTGSLLRDGTGIENPTGSRTALHDHTQQSKGFGTISYLLDDSSRLNFMFGLSSNHFQIPDVPGQTPSYALQDHPTVNSATLDARQSERNSFQVLSYQGHIGEGTDYQLSVFHRATDVHYAPDPVGDLVFNGIAAEVKRKNIADGVQLDSSMAMGPTHTLRGGFFLQHEKFNVNNVSQVFPADVNGNQTSTTPISIQDDTRIAGNLWGVYLQDEWQPVKGLTINYGARYDDVHTVVKERQLSPRLGMVFDASSTLRLHAGFARYFTPPPTEKIDTTSVVKFAGTTNALPSDADTAVKSERSNYFDAGLSWDATPNLSLGIDAYERQVANLQDEGQFGNALIYSAFNYAKGRVRGLELTANYKVDAFTTYANVAFSRAQGKQIVTGQFNFDPTEIDYIATHWVHLDHDQAVTASAGISYRFATKTSLGADALFGSGLRRGFANSAHLPSYSQVNASISQAFDLGGIIGKTEARLSVINVFDHVYELRDGTGIGVGAPQFAPRRALYASVTKSF